MEENKELLDYLVNAYVDSVTAAFSDDPSMLAFDRKRFEHALNRQTIYTEYDVRLEASKRLDFITPPPEQK